MCRGEKTADHTSREGRVFFIPITMFLSIPSSRKVHFCARAHAHAPPKNSREFPMHQVASKKLSDYKQEGPFMSFDFCGYYVGSCVIKNRRNVMLKFERRERSRETDPPSVPFRRNSERREECRQAGSILLSFPNFFSKKNMPFIFWF